MKGGTETILIVEDDRDVINMLTKILESQGYTTIAAVDGDDAIEVYHAHKEADRSHYFRRGHTGEKRQGNPRRDHPHRPFGQGNLHGPLHRRRGHRQGHSPRQCGLSPEASLGDGAPRQAEGSARQVGVPEELGRFARSRIGFFPERSSGKKCEELCRSAVLWDFNTGRLYGFGDDGRVESGSFRLIER